jgi:DNA-binding XRE family transcriptional regulator
MLARRIDPPDHPSPTPEPSAARRAQGRWRAEPPIPTRGPRGEVLWWQRPAPRGDTLLWEAVQRLHHRRLRRGMSVRALADELVRIGHGVRRETLSRVLNGKQRTSWDTAEAMAEVLGVDLDDLRARGGGTVVRFDRER